MSKSHFSFALCAAALAALVTGAASAQSFPSKPVRLLTTAPASGSDLVSRLVASGIQGRLGKPVIVENLGSGVLSVTTTARAVPDGHVILLQGNSMWVRPFLEEVDYDTARDFEPVIHTHSQPGAMAVNPKVPANTLSEFIALAKSQPGKLFYATGSTGNLTHMAAELFMSMSGTKLERINYKAGAAAANDVVAGRVEVMFQTVSSLLPVVKTGKLRALGVTSLKRTQLSPDLPPIADTLPGYEYVSNGGIFAPAKTPRAIVARLNNEINVALKQLDAQFNDLGLDAVGGSPEAFRKAIQDEAAIVGKIVKEQGIK